MGPKKHTSLFMQRSFSPLNEEKDENLKELVLQNELKVGVLGELGCAFYHPGSRPALPPLFLVQGSSLRTSQNL